MSKKQIRFRQVVYVDVHSDKFIAPNGFYTVKTNISGHGFIKVPYVVTVQTGWYCVYSAIATTSVLEVTFINQWANDSQDGGRFLLLEPL